MYKRLSSFQRLFMEMLYEIGYGMPVAFANSTNKLTFYFN